MIGKRLKQLRGERKLTQKELSLIIKVAPSTLAMYETNKRTPDYEILKRIASFFKVSTDDLLGHVNFGEIIRGGTIEYEGEIIDLETFLNTEKDIYIKGKKLSEEKRQELKSFVSYLAYKEG